MPIFDFFGTEVDTSDAESYRELISVPLRDATSVMHTKTCENHGFEIDRDSLVNLLPEEVRAISFIVPYWSTFLNRDVVARIWPEELTPALHKVDEAALLNQGIEISVPEAEVLYCSLVAMNNIIEIRNSILYAFGLTDEEP